MTMVKKETAEEKLLKIIEAAKKAKGLSSSASSPSLARVSQRRISISVRQINIILFAALLAGLLFLVNEIRSGNMLLDQDVAIAVDAAPVNTQSAALPQMKNISYYADKIASRNIFQPYDKKAVEQKEAATKINLQTKMSKYKLVGVAWLDVPESATVMIEDTAKRETRFLREGDKIEDVKVKTIYTDRVVFSYANEEITIKL
jgi:type II secretory pathway component PulC